MNESSLSTADKTIERIVQFSAEAQARRREVAKDSLAFHNLTGTIAAYGKILGLLCGLQQVQAERYPETVDERGLTDCDAAPTLPAAPFPSAESNCRLAVQ
jgi:hypothetical protein